MPNYDFVCAECGNKFEKRQKITAAPVGKCPECGSNTVKRCIGGGSCIIFKGSGFYCNDYKGVK